MNHFHRILKKMVAERGDQANPMNPLDPPLAPIDLSPVFVLQYGTYNTRVKWLKCCNFKFFHPSSF